MTDISIRVNVPSNLVVVKTSCAEGTAFRVEQFVSGEQVAVTPDVIGFGDDAQFIALATVLRCVPGIPVSHNPPGPTVKVRVDGNWCTMLAGDLAFQQNARDDRARGETSE